MTRRINLYSKCVGFSFSVILTITVSLCTYHSSLKNQINIRKYFQAKENMDNAEDELLKIMERAVVKTRSRIAIDLWNYNFNSTGIRHIEEFLMEAGGQPLRSLIITTWRSGSTFLGDLLNAMPGNFYHYEPLLSYGIIQIRGAPHGNEALETIKNMFTCSYNNISDYFQYGKTHMNQFNHNTRLWEHCILNHTLCMNANFTGRLCKLFPFHSMKVVRLRLRLVEDILQDESLNVKVVLLIRDPRGVMQSRKHRDFCKPAPDCWQPELLCADMVSDYVAASRLMVQFPRRIMVLRYEELALNPKSTTQQLFKFLGLNLLPAIDYFLHWHTNNEVAGVSSTFRVSRDVPFRWKSTLNFTEVLEIQMVCRIAMNLWGYRRARNVSHIASKKFNPVRNYLIKRYK